jgi:hypothetical protein
MADVNDGLTGAPNPAWAPQEPFDGRASGQQGPCPPSPPQGPAADMVFTFHDVVTPSEVKLTESMSPWIAVVCGLLSWSCLWGAMIPFFIRGLGMMLPIAALIFGVQGRREASKGRTSYQGMATAGIWLGVIAMVPIAFLLLVEYAFPPLW